LYRYLSKKIFFLVYSKTVYIGGPQKEAYIEGISKNSGRSLVRIGFPIPE
jgi:hypothetical protein